MNVDGIFWGGVLALLLWGSVMAVAAYVVISHP